jgi:hypothetical protein
LASDRVQHPHEPEATYAVKDQGRQNLPLDPILHVRKHRLTMSVSENPSFLPCATSLKGSAPKRDFPTLFLRTGRIKSVSGFCDLRFGRRQPELAMSSRNTVDVSVVRLVLAAICVFYLTSMAAASSAAPAVIETRYFRFTFAGGCEILDK